jgi:hypothetical protein
MRQADIEQSGQSLAVRGTVKPSALAIMKSMTRSNLVGWLTRVSPGLLSTYSAMAPSCTTD